VAPSHPNMWLYRSGPIDTVSCMRSPACVHEDPQRLTDNLSRTWRGREPRGAARLVFVGIRQGEGQARQRREDCGSGAVDDTECGWETSVQSQRSTVGVGRQRESQHAADANGRGPGSETCPAGVNTQILGVQDNSLRD